MKTLLKLTVLFTLLTMSSIDVKASHISSGYITYEYVGDTAHPYRYKISLVINRDASGQLPPNPTASIYIKSSCFPGAQRPLPLEPGSGLNNYIPSNDACIDASSPEYMVIEEWKYSDTVDLPGPCSDYQLVFSVCCRTPSITTGFGGSGAMHTYTTLNTFVPNSTPTFGGQTSHLICANQLYNIPSFSSDIDGDFLVYELSPPLGSMLPPYNEDSLVYSAPYHSKYPLTTDSLYPLTVGRHTGDISLYPTLQEGTGFAVDVKEYRYDSIAGSYVLIARMHKEYLLIVSASCSPGVTEGVNFSSIDTSSSALTPVQLVSCEDSVVSIKAYGKSIDCSSIAIDGSDFTLEDSSSGTIIPILSAQANCIGYSDSLEVDIKLGQQLNNGGDFLLITQKGSDSTVISNQCGFSSQPGDTIILRFDSTITIPPTYETGQLSGPNPQIDFTCGESIIQMNMSKSIDCSSVALDGSDFNILNTTTGKNVHIKSASAINCVGGFTSVIELEVDTPLFEQADYFVVSKVGSDANTIVPICGPDMAVNDILVLSVDTTCSGISVTENALSKSINIYPNPTNDYVNITGLESQATIKLTDVLGNELRHLVSKEKNIQFSLSDLPKGLYFLQIKQANKVLAVERIIKE